MLKKLRTLFKKKPKYTRKLNTRLLTELGWTAPPIQCEEDIARANVLLKLEKILRQEGGEVD